MVYGAIRNLDVDATGVQTSQRGKQSNDDTDYGQDDPRGSSGGEQVLRPDHEHPRDKAKVAWANSQDGRKQNGQVSRENNV